MSTPALPVWEPAELTWHMDWWWTAALDATQGRVPRSEMRWPGTGASAVTRIRELAVEWRALLADLDEPVSWVNIELTKNIAEIGQLRLLRAATSAV